MFILDSFCCLTGIDGMGIFTDKNRFDDDFADLIRRCGPDILKRLKRLGASHEEAEDSLQEALCLLLEGLAKGSLVIDGETSAKLIEGRLRNPKLCGWVAETAIHKWRNDQNRGNNLRNILTELFQSAPSGSPPNLDKIIVCLEKVLLRLSKECRLILQWGFLDGFSEAEIANRLGFAALEPVRKRIRECLRGARRFLGESDCLFI
jgi:DNA-directed RNA polymerase specialized sigma24 family protein